MKYLLTSIILLACLVNTSQAQKEPPPGVIPLTDSLFIDEHPINNINYAEFLSAVERFWSPERSDSIGHLPLFGISLQAITIMFANKDSVNWRLQHRTFIQSMQIPKTPYTDLDMTVTLKKYITREKIRNIPVTGITYMQAAMFCKWRTDMVMLLYATKKAEERGNYYLHVKYRLPTEQEWRSAFSKTGSVKNRFPFNGDFPGPFPGTRFITYKKIFSELILSEGSAMNVDQDKLIRTQRTNQTPWQEIGFRCVCEVNNKP